MGIGLDDNKWFYLLGIGFVFGIVLRFFDVFF